MTRLEFIAACCAATVSPALALEDPEIVEALRARDDARVLDLLNNHS